MGIDYEKVLRENLSEGAFPIITSNEKEFADWIQRVRWQSKRCDEMYDELKRYKDAEEQGLFLRLPCKVGDTLYSVDMDERMEKAEVEPNVIESIVICRDGDVLFKYDNYDGVICHLEHLITDKPYLDFYRVFLTREAAESALAEKGGV